MVNIKSYHILQLGKFYPIKGGVEKVAYWLSEGLSNGMSSRCDWLCALSSFSGKKMIINDNFTLFAAGTWFTLKRTLISPSMAFTLRRICNNYDVIHVHHPDPMAGVSLLLSGYKGKVVLHWHCDIVGHGLVGRLYAPIERWLIKRADRIVCTSPLYMEESQPLNRFADKKKLLCIPIGIQQPPITSGGTDAIRKRYEGKKIVFSLGRLVPYKGFEYLIEAATLLSDEYVILIGGSGPLKEKFVEMIEKMGLQNKVILLGHVSEDEKGCYMNACDLFCLPSVTKAEAFGIVQVEAMSFDKPIVATRIKGSGVQWVNVDGVTGINVTPRNHIELAEAIISITKSTDIQEKYSKEAGERYKNSFMIDGMISRFMGLYREMCC